MRKRTKFVRLTTCIAQTTRNAYWNTVVQWLAIYSISRSQSKALRSIDSYHAGKWTHNATFLFLSLSPSRSIHLNFNGKRKNSMCFCRRQKKWRFFVCVSNRTVAKRHICNRNRTLVWKCVDFLLLLSCGVCGIPCLCMKFEQLFIVQFGNMVFILSNSNSIRTDD